MRSEPEPKLADNDRENPYRSPRIGGSDSQAPLYWLIILMIRVVMGTVMSAFVGGSVWIGLLIALFGDSSDYWPGWACAIPAVLAAAVVFWWVALFRFPFRKLTSDQRDTS